MNYDISVIIASYNPSWEKLKKTVNSIIFQKNIKIEIIVADDCSENNYFDELNNLLKGKCDFKLLSSNENVGTSKNVYRALQEASSKYVKLISPGDYIYNYDTLKTWLDFVEKNNSKISFGRAVYYNDSNNGFKLIRAFNLPQNPAIFSRKNEDKILFDYLICGNRIHGAVTLFETQLMLKYLGQIKDTVKYCEDLTYPLMLTDNVRFDFFPNNVLFYECGYGMSTCGNKSWIKKLNNDGKNFYKIIIPKLPKNWLSKRYNMYFKLCYEKKLNINLIKSLLFPKSFFWRLYHKIKPSMTSVNADLDFYNKI